MIRQKEEIFFHVGLGKPEAQYLRRTFFPKLQGVRFVPRNEYQKFSRIVEREMVQKFFVSRSFDLGMESELRVFARKFPDAKIILTFRRHDRWLKDLYAYLIGQGLGMPFEEFYDAGGNSGFLKHLDCDYMGKIKFLESIFKRKPLVLFYEDLDKYPYEFFDAFAQIMDASYRKFDIELQEKLKTKVYNLQDKNISMERKANAQVFGVETVPSLGLQGSDKIFFGLKKVASTGIQVGLRMLPKKWVGNGAVVEEEEMEKIRIRHAQDWIAVHEYALENNWEDIRGAINPSVLRLGRY